MRQQMVEVRCGRCKRVEYKPVKESPVEETNTLHVKLDVPGEPTIEVRFDDLCTPCLKTVKSHLVGIVKQLDGVSPARSRKKSKPAAETPELGKGAAVPPPPTVSANATVSAKPAPGHLQPRR
jgi:hypothetical protein